MSADDTPPRAAFLARLDTAVTLLWDANRDDSEDAARPNDPEVDVWTAAANLSNTLRKYGDVVRDEVWDLLVPSADAVELHPAPAPVEVREDETVPWLKREVDEMGTALLQAEYDRESQAQAYSRLLRGMARRQVRTRQSRDEFSAKYGENVKLYFQALAHRARMRDTLILIAGDRCETYTSGRCSDPGSGRSRISTTGTADQWCDPCRAHDALAAAPETSRSTFPPCYWAAAVAPALSGPVSTTEAQEG